MSRPIGARFARRPEARNGCAHAAALVLLDFWGLPAPPLRDIYRAHPPDTPWALLGTSPRRLARMLGAHGLRARARRFARPQDARAFLEAELAAGRPVALLLDLRLLGRRLPAGHWVVAHAADAQGVALTNLVSTPRHAGPRARVAWGELLPAWRCRLAPFPSWRLAAVTAEPPVQS